MNIRNAVIAILLLILVAAGTYIYTLKFPRTPVVAEQPKQELEVTPPAPVSQLEANEVVLGTSVEGRNISAFNYGTSSATKKLVFVGGIHGGYEWNTVLAAYELMDYLKANPSVVPS